MPEMHKLSSLITDSAHTNYIQGIKEFLEKPYPLISAQLGTASTGVLQTINLYSSVLNQAIYQDKLKGFLAFRATAVVRLQVNGNRFQQGRLIMHFLPQGSVNGMYPTNMRNLDLILITQQPRVELDINTQSECVMEIPYTSPFNYLDLQNGVGNLGVLYLSVYSALEATGGSTNCDYTIWVSFKDVEIVTPSTGTLTFSTQMATGKKVKGKDLEEQETDKLSTKIRVLSQGIGDFGKTVASVFPPLTSITEPVSWALGVASGVAAAFGWSKPTVANVPMIVKFGNPPYFQNSDVACTAAVLANQSNNEVSCLPGFAGSNIDEMSITYIASRPAFFESIAWSTTSSVDTELISYPLTPAFFYKRRTTTNATNTFTYDLHTPVSYISRFFRYYRGSLKFTFKFVKTEFHSGRLVLTYTPGNGTVPVTNAATTFTFREILDIRQANEYSFVMPYASVVPYRSVLRMFGEGPNEYGSISLRVLNDLIAPANVPSTVRILVEVSAHDDFELAGPAIACAGSDATDVTRLCLPFFTQMDSSQIVKSFKPVGSSNVTGERNLAPSMYCIGEKVQSIKQLLLRYSRFKGSDSSTSTATVDVNPFHISALGMPFSGSGGEQLPSLYADYYSSLVCLYAYSRGSVRLALNRTATVNTRLTTYAYFCADTTAALPSYSSARSGGVDLSMSLITYHNFDQNNGVSEIRVPAYNCVPTRLNKFSVTATTSATQPYDYYIPKVRVVLSQSASEAGGNLHRAVGDDFQCGYFIGVPPIWVRTT